jgi:hypothetical protein
MGLPGRFLDPRLGMFDGAGHWGINHGACNRPLRRHGTVKPQAFQQRQFVEEQRHNADLVMVPADYTQPQGLQYTAAAQLIFYKRK